jgi:NADH-quinone oxidoreductase subunit N
VAQAGYILSGVVVGTQLGIQATVLYLFAYLAMNMAPFAVVVAVERERPALGDDISNLSGLGARDPWLAWPMTIGMLALAGIPGTVGFIGKFQLIHALVNGSYTWLAIVLVVGSMISLGYYLRVLSYIWMRPAVTAGSAGGVGAQPSLAPIAGGSQEADEPDAAESGPPSPSTSSAGPGVDVPPGPPAGEAPATAAPLQFEVAFVALGFAAATIFFGIVPSPLFDFVAHAGHAIAGLF